MKPEYKEQLLNLDKEDLITIISILLSSVTDLTKREAYKELYIQVLEKYIRWSEEIDDDIEQTLTEIVTADESKYVVYPSVDYTTLLIR